MYRDPGQRVHWGFFPDVSASEMGQATDELSVQLTLQVLTGTAEVKTRETVATETPAAAATSLIVGPLSGPRRVRLVRCRVM